MQQRFLDSQHATVDPIPEQYWPTLFPNPHDVHILIVTDTGGSFGGGSFAMRDLVETLQTPPGPWVRFSVTKANRRVDPTADISNFRFDDQDLTRYDEIWLLGVERLDRQEVDPKRLPPAELAALAGFMEDGGGVFATGDHEDLGVNLAGEVPRVRTMRRWYIGRRSPLGQPDAPAQFGSVASNGEPASLQLDTLVDPPGPRPGDQTDDIPQQVRPVWRYAPTGVPWMSRRFPHPLLCGPRGVITVLPDHMHEGRCDAPSDLSGTFELDGRSRAEYPVGREGHQESPVEVAYAVSHFGAGGPFPVIAAYDGHRVQSADARPGRVVTDATWHHFFNINTQPFKVGPSTGAGRPAAERERDWLDIQAYYRNIAVWLARPRSHTIMAARAAWAARWYGDVVITVLPGNGNSTLGNVWLGTVARDVLGRLSSPCQSMEFYRNILEAALAGARPEILRGDIWAGPPPPGPDPVSWLDREIFVTAAMGGAMQLLAENVAHPFEGPPEDDKLLGILADGMLMGLRNVGKDLASSVEELPKIVDALTRL